MKSSCKRSLQIKSWWALLASAHLFSDDTFSRRRPYRPFWASWSHPFRHLEERSPSRSPLRFDRFWSFSWWFVKYGFLDRFSSHTSLICSSIILLWCCQAPCERGFPNLFLSIHSFRALVFWFRFFHFHPRVKKASMIVFCCYQK